MFHPYVNMGMPNMSSSSCRQAILLPVEWHVRFAQDYPFGISLKAFYDVFLGPLGSVEAQPYADVMPPRVQCQLVPRPAWGCRHQPLSCYLLSCMGPMMAGCKSRPRRFLLPSMPQHSCCPALPSRLEWNSSDLTWQPNMPLEKRKNYHSMLIGKLERTTAMPLRPLKAILGWQSWRRCCTYSMRLAKMTCRSSFMLWDETRKRQMMPWCYKW